MTKPGETTIYTIAAELGVNPATVSRALRQAPNIGDELRRKVREVAEREGFRPRPIVRRRVTVAALVETQGQGGELLAGATAVVLEGLWDAARVAGAELSLFGGNGETLNEAGLLRRLGRRGVDGAVVLNAGAGSAYVRVLRDKRFPCCCVLGAPAGGEAYLFGVDEVAVGAHAARHLLGLGHRALAVVGGVPFANSDAPRVEGVRGACADAGLPGEAVCVVPASLAYADGFECGGCGAATLLRMRPDITAICALDGATAIGAVRGLRERGVSVPGDVSVLACDDTAVCAHVSPALTAVRIPYRRLGTAAFQWVCAAVVSGTPLAPPAGVGSPFELLVRESTGTVRPRGAAG
jgi:LacI family transcriptional regulator